MVHSNASAPLSRCIEAGIGEEHRAVLQLPFRGNGGGAFLLPRPPLIPLGPSFYSSPPSPRAEHFCYDALLLTPGAKRHRKRETQTQRTDNKTQTTDKETNQTALLSHFSISVQYVYAHLRRSVRYIHLTR